jgi:heat shock protein HslJ
MSRKIIAAILFFVSFTLTSVAANAAGPEGKWLAEDIDGGGVIDRLQTTLEIRDDGIVTGMGGCNRYAGSATISGDAIRFLPMASTRMACSASVMRQESRFHSTLEKVTAWRVDQAQKKLVLLDKGGFDLMRLSKMN